MIQLILLVLVIAIDVYVNYYLIEKKKVDPNHTLNWSIRAILGIAIGYDSNLYNWFIHTLSYMPIYWFFFDYSLNVARKKPIFHLGSHWIDTLQKKILDWGQAWFVLKFMLALYSVSTILFDYEYVL